MENEFKRLMEIIENVDENEYPETIDIVKENISDDDGDGVVWEDSFEIANQLADADSDKVMPKLVADYVIDVYLEEIESENAEAMNNLGALYYGGRCGEQSYEKAVKYYTMAAEHGNRLATQNLGYCYYYGRNVPVDYKKAYHYFIKGALDHHLNSLYKIGDMYKNGYYVEKDEREAFIIYSTCYREMDDECAYRMGADICLRMGNAFFYGTGTEVNYSTALEFYKEAEKWYYIQIKNGDIFGRKGLESVIEKMNIIRDKLNSELPGYEWNEEYGRK